MLAFVRERELVEENLKFGLSLDAAATAAWDPDPSDPARKVRVLAGRRMRLF